MCRIHYAVQPYHPEAHKFEVTLRIPQPNPGGQKITLPAWIPGSYMIRDFAKNILTIQAETEGGEVRLTKIDKQTWITERCDKPITISYQVYAWDLSVRSAHLDTRHGFFNGASLFLRVVGQESSSCNVTLCPPTGERYKEWRVATTLTRLSGEDFSFGEFQAENYWQMIDHPVEMGTFTATEFTVANTPHVIAITGRHSADYQRLSEDMKRICETEVKLFGSLPTMERYLFLLTVVGDGYGGIEHKTSTALIARRDSLFDSKRSDVSEKYQELLGLCSHEYFHLWNVKRIVPRQFFGSDLSGECYSRLLWVFEGITSYYDDLILVRSGVITKAAYLKILARLVTRVIRTPGRKVQTIEESSFDAWTKFYKQDENAPNAIISYYAKGALIALLLDLQIRHYSKGCQSLDHVMRYLWHEHGKQDKPIEEDEMEAIILRITGVDLGDFFNIALRSTQELPIQEWLERFGINTRFRARVGESDKGGQGVDYQSDFPTPQLGMVVTPVQQDVKVSSVLDKGPAQAAGISAGDILIAIDHLKITTDNVNWTIENLEIGQTVSVHVFRRDELLHLSLTPKTPEQDTCDLWCGEHATEEQAIARQRWLDGDG